MKRIHIIKKVQKGVWDKRPGYYFIKHGIHETTICNRIGAGAQ